MYHHHLSSLSVLRKQVRYEGEYLSRIQVCAFAKLLVSITGLFANIIEGIDGTVGKHVHLHVHG